MRFNKKNRKARKKRKRRSARRNSAYGMLLLVVCSSLLFLYNVFHLQPADDWFEGKASDPSKIKLPEDDAPHQTQVEWWYYNGLLISESGKQFSFHDTVFLVNSMQNHVVSHISVNDHQTGKHFTDQYRAAGYSAISTEKRFEFKHNGWLMSGSDGRDRLKVTSKDFAFNFELSSTQPTVLHGNNGIISLGSFGSSYYYSRTRMAITGTVRIGTSTQNVKGVGWYDHQWGDFSVGQLAWDWFSLQLDKNIDVMVYQLRDKSGQPVLYTASVTQNGTTEVLQNREFTLTPGEKWRSPRSGIEYPLKWVIDIPKKKIKITVRSIIDDSEFDAQLTTYNNYWEGPVTIQGTHSGHGFMELSGYVAAN